MEVIVKKIKLPLADLLAQLESMLYGGTEEVLIYESPEGYPIIEDNTTGDIISFAPVDDTNEEDELVEVSSDDEKKVH